MHAQSEQIASSFNESPHSSACFEASGIGDVNTIFHNVNTGRKNVFFNAFAKFAFYVMSPNDPFREENIQCTLIDSD